MCYIVFGNASLHNVHGSGQSTSWTCYLWGATLKNHGNHLLGDKNFFSSGSRGNSTSSREFGLKFAPPSYGPSRFRGMTLSSTPKFGPQRDSFSAFGTDLLTMVVRNKRKFAKRINSPKRSNKAYASCLSSGGAISTLNVTTMDANQLCWSPTGSSIGFVFQLLWAP